MKNFIDHISIQNFKSIRDLKLEGLERINLFIGKPNVGKSNILEAFGVFSLPYLKYSSNKKLSSLIRANYIGELFFDGETKRKVSLTTNIGQFNLQFEFQNSISDLISSILVFFKVDNVNTSISFDKELNVSILGNEVDRNPIKYFIFDQSTKSRKSTIFSLIPPSGANLMNAIEHIPSLKEEISGLFKEYGLKLVLDKASNEIKIMKESKNDEVFLIPYSSIADTLQRIIFYKTAIATNSDSVLIFEEPEAHAFPPYIVHITHEIVESKSNQFILSTHSPYILDYFLENAIDELAIFMVDYKNGETVANKLSKEDMIDIRQYGIDLFTNYETFLK